jgi:hypothetical protein
MEIVERGDTGTAERLRPPPELISNVVPTAISELRSNEIEVLFNQFDTDGSGLIDADELQAALSKDGRELSKAEVLEILDTVDTNSDGSVSYDEFERIFTLSPDELPVGVQPLVDATRSERIAGLDRRVGDLDAQIAMLKEERSLILDKRRDVQNWYDEVRFEVSGVRQLASTTRHMPVWPRCRLAFRVCC